MDLSHARTQKGQSAITILRDYYMAHEQSFKEYAEKASKVFELFELVGRLFVPCSNFNV